MLGFGRIERADGTHLRHAPAVPYAHAELFRQHLDHRGRASRAADRRRFQRREPELVLLHVVDQIHPYGGHCRGAVDGLRFDQLEEACAVEPRARKHELGTGQRRGVRNSPGVDMEHRHNRQHRARRRQVLGVRQRNRESVQDGRPMAEEHALRLAGGARGVAERRRGVLFELRPLEIIGLGCDEILVAGKSRDRRLWPAAAVGHRHPVLHALALGGELLDQRREREIEEHDRIFGVADDVGELLVEQTRIDRVGDRAHARDRVVELEVAITIPGERSDPVSGNDAQPRQGAGEPARASMRVAVRIAVDRPFDGARHDLGVAVIAVRVPDQR